MKTFTFANKKINILLTPAVIIFGMIITSVLSFSATMEKTSQQAETILKDSAREQSSILKVKLQDELDKLHMMSTMLTSENLSSPEAISRRLKAINRNILYNSLGYADRNGLTILSNGQIINISDRNYFQKCLGGQRIIEWLNHSRSDGLSHFIFSVPVSINRQIHGVVFAECNQIDLQNLLVSQAYNAQAYSFVTDNKGQVLIADEKSALNASVSNFFTELTHWGTISSNDLLKMQADMLNGVGGSVNIRLRNENMLATYEPLNTSNWYIFNVIPTTLITTEVNRSIKNNLFHYVTAIILTLIACLTLIFNEKQNNKQLAEDAEKQRLSKESYRIAIEQSNKKLIRYNPIEERAIADDENSTSDIITVLIEHGPQGLLESKTIASESKPDCREFFHSIKSGFSPVSTRIRLNTPDKNALWYQLDATTIFNNEGTPLQTIISYYDISEQRKKEVAYEKWKHEIETTITEGVSSFEWNLNQNLLEASSGPMSTEVSQFFQSGADFNTDRKTYAEHSIAAAHRQAFLTFLNRERLIGSYHDGKTTDSFEYQQLTPGHDPVWILLNYQLIPYPDSNDIKAYLLFRNIDEEKRAELELKERSEKDLLTGTLNRGTFIAKTIELLSHSSPTSQHGFFMLDIDNFKLVNDTYGHATGDEVLVNFSNRLRGLLRSDDLLCRLGGDEFIICLKDVPYDGIIKKKAQQICDLLQREFDSKLRISTSLGISVYPRNGKDFETLYQNADNALYQAKKNGKAGYCFYDSEQSGKAVSSSSEEIPTTTVTNKRKMLIVDDEKINLMLLDNMFNKEFEIHTAENGFDALSIMKRFGSGISIVLLDLIMPSLDGFGVLDNINRTPDLRDIPIIVVSGSDDINTSLKAIKAGAADYIAKPVNAGLLRIRVASALTKTENEKLLAQNSYLRLQSDEEAKYRTVLSSTGTIVIEHDWINQLFVYDQSINEHLFGKYNNNSTLWKIFSEYNVAGKDDIDKMQTLVTKIANNKTLSKGTIDVLLKSLSGAMLWYRMNIVQITDEFRTINKLIITFNNINDEYLANKQLHFQAERDALTGLYNRTTFISQSQQLLKDKQPNSYILSYCDIDNFKTVNELYGHSFGDKMLRHLAESIQSSVEIIHGISGRVSGDCFVLLYPNTNDFGKQIEGDVVQRFKTMPIAASINLSFGSYTIDDPSLPIDTMMDRASLAQKTIKGKYNIHSAYYDETLSKHFLREQEIIRSMESALQKEQFHVFYQPQYDHNNGQLVGAEALVRWLHPVHGIIPPGSFIPVFEKNGFITQLDEYVWRKTAQNLHCWLQTGLNVVPVSVNVSRMDLFNPKLRDILISILKENEIPTELYRLEITESAYISNTEQLIAVVKDLQEAGFIIEMDDFGSGYSSLNLLKEVPVDIIKLDMRFLMGNDPLHRSGNILNSIIRMSRWMNLPVIAEGVETAEQADFLQSVGCHIIQGYLYARPMPAAEFEIKLSGDNVSRYMFNDVETSWDKQSFWSSDSADTILFSNFIDAAAIYEYHNGKAEMLRLNKRYSEILQLENDELDNLHSTGFSATVKEDIPKIMAAAQETIKTGEDGTVDFRRILVKKNNAILWVRICFRILMSNKNRTIFFVSLQDVTEEYRLRDEVERLKTQNTVIKDRYNTERM